MIAIDTSVALKWYKPGEPHEMEARDLLKRLERGEVQAMASEIMALEVVRGLKKAQVNIPSLGILDADILDVFNHLESMVSGGMLQHERVEAVRALARDLIIALNLAAADALHLATAIHAKAHYFVTEDQYLLKPGPIGHAGTFGVRVVDLPNLIAALNASAAGPTPPSP